MRTGPHATCGAGQHRRVRVLTCVQRAQLLAQQARQHGDNSVDQIDAGATLAGLRVQRAARWHEERHVSDVHAHPEGSPGQRLNRQGVV